MRPRRTTAHTTRRELLQAIGLGAAAASLTGVRTLAAQSASPVLDATPLRDGLLQISGAGCNIIALTGSDGLLLVDSGAAEHAQQLNTFITEQFGAAPVRVLFNTHWHLDHTGGNDAIVRDGVTAISHENTRLWMSTKFYVDWENKQYARRAASAWPNKTFLSHEPQPQLLTFGESKVSYAHLLGAHTDGDIYVAFPDHNVIAAGGAVTADEYPVLDYITGGWIGGMVEATKKLIAMTDAETLIVPASGPVRRRADLEAQLEMLETVRQRIEAIALEGRGVEDMIAENITKDFDSRYRGDSGLFIANAYEGMWWNRLRGTVA
jgi:glyoxylase-like metal-dependent hydrolase (beta-lactamase superfamily II)